MKRKVKSSTSRWSPVAPDVINVTLVLECDHVLYETIPDNARLNIEDRDCDACSGQVGSEVRVAMPETD